MILQGARQVGKTWLMKHFGKNEFSTCVYVNFEKDTWAFSLFDKDYDVERILLFLQAHTGVKIEAEKTLLIFDEVQEVPRGLESLKYFCEDKPQLHVMVAGSLLGIALHEGVSFPVGKVDMLTLHPMSFSEFLIALGEEIKVEVMAAKQWDVVNALLPTFEELLRQYYFVGGMPEAVASFVAEKNLKKVRTIQKNILAAYRNDVSKHAPTSEVPRINMVLDAIPSQLAKENKKFIYGALKKGARAKEFELAIQWLIDAGIVLKINRTAKPTIPLKIYEDFGAFKLFLCDCGLLGCLAEAPQELVITNNDIFKEYKGAYTESFVAQQLVCNQDLCIYYWSQSDSKCEIDFLVQSGSRVIPIEVKAEDNVHSKSLATFCRTLYPGLQGLRLSMKPHVEQDWMQNFPLCTVEHSID
ncbi:MAG: ATP-binding protein [Bacteroidales bacterium]|nr:ATP-binding protein [Bacteroidales bacterium]